MITFLRRLFLHDFWLKLFSLALAILIWLTVSSLKGNPSPVDLRSAISDDERSLVGIPVLVMSSAADSRSFKVNPIEVSVTVVGDSRKLQKLQPKDVRALVDLTGVESARNLLMRVEVTAPADVRVVQVVPEQVEVTTPPKR